MTIQNTPVYAFPYPQGGDAADGPSQIGALAARMEAVLQPIQNAASAKDSTVGTLSARPAAGTIGRRYVATDVVAEYIDTGSGWLRISMPPGMSTAILGAVPTGWWLADGGPIANSGISAELFAAIGGTMPDLRGRVPVGVDGAAARLDANDALGNVGGVQKHTLAALESGTNGNGATNADGGAHNHTITVNQSNIGQTSGWNLPTADSSWELWGAALGSFSGGVRTAGTNVSWTSGVHNHTAGATPVGNHGHVLSARAADSAHQNMQPYQVLNWIVKL